MRITGGKYRGRTIVCPPGVIRPAMDRMRESLFSILGDLTDRSFLDLFSGSGTMALEAVSRGARPVIAVEKDRGKRAVIEKNLAIAAEQIELHFLPAERFLKRGNRQFDVVFMDPPFAYRFKGQLLGWAAEGRLLSAGGLLLIHHPAAEELPERISGGDAAGLSRVDHRRYGGSAVDFYGPAVQEK